MRVRTGSAAVPITRVEAAAYTLPTEGPEADGTLAWQATTLVVVEIQAGDQRGLGYTYADAASAQLINTLLAATLRNLDALATPACWTAMVRAVRNLGRSGVAACAISALDAALWDLKAKLFDVALVTLLGPMRAGVPAYGSGGFTTYSIEALRAQLAGWVEDDGLTRVKMKVGAHPEQDLARVAAARHAIGSGTELFVDANGAYSRKQALGFAAAFAELGVRWFEEPVSSDDLEGLRLLRDRAPAGLDVAAGEYGYDGVYFRRMLEAGAVDVLQADATRCLGLSGFLQASALCQAHMIPLSAHTAPSLHAHAGCALAPVRHVEYFFDHARIERLLFDGALAPRGGLLVPDLGRPGLGLEFKRRDAARYAV